MGGGRRRALVDGGDATYLAHRLRESGVADLLPELPGQHGPDPRIGQDFVEWADALDDRTLGVVDFSLLPHLGAYPDNSREHAERWAAGLDNPAYALDEQSWRPRHPGAAGLRPDPWCSPR